MPSAFPPSASLSYPMNPGATCPPSSTQFPSGQNPSFSAPPYAPQSYSAPFPQQPNYPSMNYPGQSGVNPGMSMSSNYPGQASSHTNAFPGSYPGGQGAGAYQSATTMAYRPNSSASAPRMTPVNFKPSPTVVPFPGFNSREDAEVLRKAMKGFGTDEKAIINVLANRTNLQRQEIAVQFKTLYGKDLIKDLKSELSGNFEDLVVAMMTPIPDYYAKELHEAMSDTSGNFKRLMVSLCCGHRDESFEVNPSAAMEDARQLLQAGELRFGTDESTFNAILVQRNILQLKQIFAELVVTRVEIDMGEIKQAYLQKYGKTLEDAIADDCSGHYKKCLLALIA
ncbi:hypothetical protein G9C98_001665 [Cotesia typhae]|uniref:Annexin n=1 Tax=Cotesia typhae TaxID=2053667 RepID=A0A8J5UTA6_9HYME|nr:hypothetical protein G9C98_001665 [Cotesia typhae]